jgi:signal transduction histidine kinase
MPRLFHKIFLWFWLGMVVVCVTVVALTSLSRSRASLDERWRNKYGPIVDLWAQREAEVFDREGSSGLEKYIGTFVKEPGVHGYMFDEGGKEVLGREAPARVWSIVEPVAQSGQAGPVFFAKERIIAENTVGPSGRHYVVVVTRPQPSVFRRRLFDFLFADVGGEGVTRLAAILLVAGFFCYWAARQITKPINELRLATREIANQHLDARVDAKVLARRDELADLGRDFDRMAERIDTLVSAQRRLLADVSHALRSPLARLSVALGLARESAKPAMLEHLDRIERESDRLNQLIGQLLTISRMDSGIAAEEKKPFDLTLLVEEVAADGSYEAQSRNCAVECDLPAECMIEGAPELLRVALENVVRNAVRHTIKGTNVEISMACRHVDDEPRTVIEVRDHGTGVPENAISELFRPFYQVPGDVPQHGSGLGLAITARILRLHGGEVKAVNAPGGGLVVSLELPMLDAKSAQFSKRADVDGAAVEGKGAEVERAAGV